MQKAKNLQGSNLAKAKKIKKKQEILEWSALTKESSKNTRVYQGSVIYSKMIWCY